MAGGEVGEKPIKFGVPGRGEMFLAARGFARAAELPHFPSFCRRVAGFS